MKSDTRLQLLFAITGLLGLFIVAYAVGIEPIMPVFAIDRVLTPVEVQDPKLREIVRRTAEFAIPSLQYSVIYAVFGGMISATSMMGLLALRGHRKDESCSLGCPPS